jgi:hypothetical protein
MISIPGLSRPLKAVGKHVCQWDKTGGSLGFLGTSDGTGALARMYGPMSGAWNRAGPAPEPVVVSPSSLLNAGP